MVAASQNMGNLRCRPQRPAQQACAFWCCLELELELELLQSQMAQKPILRDEVGARALRVGSVSREEVWESAGVQGPWVSGCGCEAD